MYKEGLRYAHTIVYIYYTYIYNIVYTCDLSTAALLRWRWWQRERERISMYQMYHWNCLKKITARGNPIPLISWYAWYTESRVGHAPKDCWRMFDTRGGSSNSLLWKKKTIYRWVHEKHVFLFIAIVKNYLFSFHPFAGWSLHPIDRWCSTWLICSARNSVIFLLS